MRINPRGYSVKRQQRKASILVSTVFLALFILPQPQAFANHSACATSAGPTLQYTNSVGADMVRGHGKTVCDYPFTMADLTVCVQKHTWWVFWKNLSCSTSPPAYMTTEVSHSESAACIPGTETYRSSVDYWVQYIDHAPAKGTVESDGVTFTCNEPPPAPSDEEVIRAAEEQCRTVDEKTGEPTCASIVPAR